MYWADVGGEMSTGKTKKGAGWEETIKLVYENVQGDQ
jgi:hypothetical protein